METDIIPKTMRALQIVEFGKPYVYRHDVPVPKIQDDELLIKIAVAGYCHTEVMVARGDFARTMDHSPLPQIPSHEPTGYVAAIGSAVAPGRFQVGQRVGSLGMQHRCGKCPDCVAGMHQFCDVPSRMAGITCDGAFAEYMVADPDFVFVLPDNLSFESAAPLFCAGITIFRGLKTCNLPPGHTLAVVGAGALGHIGVQFAKYQGLNVVCVDVRDAPLEMVMSLKHKPDIVVNSSAGVEAALKKIPWPVDATLVAADHVSAYEFALQITRKHGLMVVVGQPDDAIPIHWNHLIFRDITVKGSSYGSPSDTREMLSIVADKGIEVRTTTYQLEEVETMLKDGAKQGRSGKMVIKVSD